MTKPPNSFHLERQFGYVVGGVFLAIGLWALWRARWPWPSAALRGGRLSPGRSRVVHAPALVRPRRAWMALAEALSFVSTRVILGLVFFVGIAPTGFVMRLFGWDPLARKQRAGGSLLGGLSAPPTEPEIL